ncbi:MAG: hypothetical protein AB1601_01335 [Planctomycetota bacterium]
MPCDERSEGEKLALKLVRGLSKDEATCVIAILSLGAARLLSHSFRFWPIAEQLVFNGQTLLLCLDAIGDQELGDVVAAGNEIEDVMLMFSDPAKYAENCALVETGVLAVLARFCAGDDV